jgi:DNA-directed RNA polymerase specialized sigma24 family protein
MAAPESPDFFALLRSSDGPAVEELLNRLAPFLRSTIHLRLIGGRLRGLTDTTDILQSLLKDFLSRREPGHSPADGSAELCAYLAAAVHHKICTKMRKERRHGGSLPEECEPVSPEPPPAQHVEGLDLRQAIRDRLSEQTRQVFDLRTQGLTWAEIAGQVGGNPDALRMRLRRTVATILGELGHEELGHAG